MPPKAPWAMWLARALHDPAAAVLVLRETHRTSLNAVLRRDPHILS